MSNAVERALISVSDKTGVLEFAQALSAQGVEILSTGGTAKLLMENQVAVKEVSSHTGFPEMMDGRIKTLHPKIHGGILARRGIDDAIMAEHEIGGIDLVVVNLYPFEATVANPDCLLPDAIENIDIGGPTMLRAAAKNHKDVVTEFDFDGYDSEEEYLQFLEASKNSLKLWATSIGSKLLNERFLIPGVSIILAPKDKLKSSANVVVCLPEL